MHRLKNGHPAHELTTEDRRKAAAVTNEIRREKRETLEEIRSKLAARALIIREEAARHRRREKRRERARRERARLISQQAVNRPASDRENREKTDAPRVANNAKTTAPTDTRDIRKRRRPDRELSADVANQEF